MLNRYGKTASERINEDIKYIETVIDMSQKKMLAFKVLGAADLAVEFNLITYTEWERYIEQIFKLM